MFGWGPPSGVYTSQKQEVDPRISQISGQWGVCYLPKQACQQFRLRKPQHARGFIINIQYHPGSKQSFCNHISCPSLSKILGQFLKYCMELLLSVRI
ncbi:hypothetical protein NPIL_246691 [Nephila pilipes]|uniref:Uncharacterized protein n=1 Tax=Nephila pilipes TaxID=299642 RepID=A0A8X6PGI3_NEPPI|nr:hypothetical protein NPIL_246691 [Nephila pilipes]